MTLRALLEISRETLERYGDRARASHRKLARAVGDSERRYGGANDVAAHPRAYASYEKKHKKMVARETGIRRANDRLVGHPGTLDYHWGRHKPSRRTKSGHHEPYHQESWLGEMSYRLLDRYVRRAEGDPRRAQGLARARVRLDLKRINFRDPMREDAGGAPVVDADKQARALRLKRLLAMASQAQQGIGDQTKRPGTVRVHDVE